MGIGPISAQGGGSGTVTGTGASGQVSFWSGASAIAGSASLLWDNAKKLFTVSGRVRRSKGADVASANDLTLGLDGNCFTVTGTTQINGIATADWTAGSDVVIEFSAALTVKHNTAPGAGFAPLYLAGAVDFSATADDILYLYYNGTVWREVARTAV